MFAHRSAAGCDENIDTAFARTTHSGNDVLDAIASDADVMHLSTFRSRQRAEAKAVRINDLSGLGVAARRDKLITGS